MLIFCPNIPSTKDTSYKHLTQSTGDAMGSCWFREEPLFKMTTRFGLIILQVLIFLANKRCEATKREEQLIHYLFQEQTYNSLERPVSNESEPLQVSFGLTLQQLVDVDEKQELIQTNIMLQVGWTAANLNWKNTQYKDMPFLSIPSKMVWMPDILLYNSADENFDPTFKTNVQLTSNGYVFFFPPGIFKSTCSIDIKWFPFDQQECLMVFSSWTYSGNQLNLTLGDIDLTEYDNNAEWDLMGAPALIVRDFYGNEPYPRAEIKLVIRRRPLYYMFNLILPCVVISSIALLTFTLPPDAGEKIGLAVNIILGLTVFSLLLIEMLPASETIPLLGMYFSSAMFMCACSLIFTVLVLNFHHRDAEFYGMPNWMRKFICEWLAWVVRIKRPGKPISRKQFMSRVQLNKYLFPDKYSVEDEEMSRCPTVISLTDSSGKIIQVDMENPSDEAVDHVFSKSPALQTIYKELRFINGRFRDDDEAAEISSDWTFAAMVVDRFCFITFCLVTVFFSCAILLAAPHAT